MKVSLAGTIIFLTILPGFFAQDVFSQTLMRVGDQQVTKSEFLRAYEKNNAGSKPTDKSYREYLDLYGRYRLKVKAAYDQRLDTLPSIIAELQNFRNQIADTYLNDESYLDKLTNEALERSQKDIHLAQIFIAAPITATAADSMNAVIKLNKAMEALRKGQSFGAVADEYSDDPFAKINHGDINYITVFSLPYDLENLAYKTPPGHISAPFRSKSGYHIFKNLGERKSPGRLRAAQILLAFPIGADEPAKALVKLHADSIVRELQRGADFGTLAKKFSGDNISYQTGGEMPEFGVGRYDPVFESAAFALTKDGEISRPVLTSFGYHIIKRLALKPITPEKTKAKMEALRQQVMSDPRIESSKKAMTQSIMKRVRFSEHPVAENNLWVFTDSTLQNKTIPKFADLNSSTVLFNLDNRNYTVRDWIAYRVSIRNVPMLNRNKTNRELLTQFEEASATDYYRSHLEQYNAEFAYQFTEFKEGNLLFEVMQRQVWDKASQDSVGLKQFYTAHQNKYVWESGAEAILFTCTTIASAEKLRSDLKNGLSHWRRAVDSANGQVQADSGRFELSQLPPADQGKIKGGVFTSMTTNPADNSVIMAYVISLFPEHQARSYEEARGLAINDYQAYLEDQWIAELKKKYPVVVEEPVVRSLPK